MSDVENRQIGMVYLVGAGPGNPALITLRAAEVLGRADVILYDYLVAPEVLSHARPDAERICLGRHGHTRVWSQDDINEQISVLARAGKTVVRLKGGDPTIFARGAEETEMLVAGGIPFEMVPGITAALACGSYAGVPLTHWEVASAVAFVAGQQRSDKPTAPLDYQALARFPGTLVIYMGVTTAPEWTAALIRGGKSPQTPAMIVRRCSLPDQRTIRCTLAQVPDYLHSGSNIRPPVVVILGEVVDRAPESWWFLRRPLLGTSVMVTRAEGQAAVLLSMLAELGAEVIVQPAIRIADPEDWGPVDEALARLDQFQWLVFSSSNGVRYFLDRLKSTGRDLRALRDLRLAAIGPGTAEELASYHLRVDLVPDQFRAEALAESLEPAAARGEKFLLARASRGREVLAERLAAAGGHVEQVVVYRSTDVTQPDAEVFERLAGGGIDWVTVTSSAIAGSLVSMFGDALRHSRIVSISPVTSKVLSELGFSPDAEAGSYTMQGVVHAIVQQVCAPASTEK
jgi:uroporphyrinogen III methyltransferase/synthase